MNGFSSGKHGHSRAKASSSSRLLDFYNDQMNDGKQGTSEHHVKSSNPLARNGQKKSKKQHFTYEEPCEFNKNKDEINKMPNREQSTLTPSTIAGIPPDVGKTASRGFRGALPLDNNHALVTKRQKAILRLESGKKLGPKKEFISISNSEVFSLPDHKPMEHNIATFRRSRREETVSLPSLGSSLKRNSRECRSFPEGRRPSSYIVRQPISSLRSRLPPVEVDKKCSSQSWPGDQSSQDRHRGTSIHYMSQIQKRDLHGSPRKSKDPYRDNRLQDFSDSLNEIYEENQRLESVKRSSRKTLLPGFFALEAKPKRKSRDKRKASTSKRIKLPALTQNMFQTCVQNMGRKSTCHQQGDLKVCQKENEEEYYQRSSSSSTSYTTADEYGEVSEVPLRSCGSNQTKSRRNHKKLGTTNIIQQTLSSRHKHLPPILEQSLKHDQAPVNPSTSQSTTLDKTEPSIETSTSEEQNTLSLPPLPTVSQTADPRKDSLAHDADDEGSATYHNISTDGDVAKSPQHELSKPLCLDSEFSYRKFASSKRKKKFKLKEKGVSPVDASESSSQMLNKESQRKKHRKKKKLKAASERDTVSLKQRVLKAKRASVGSEGDDEMEDDEETNVILQ